MNLYQEIDSDPTTRGFIHRVMEECGLDSDSHYYDECGTIEQASSAAIALRMDCGSNHKTRALARELIEDYELCPQCLRAKMEPEIVEGGYNPVLDEDWEEIVYTCPECGYER